MNDLTIMGIKPLTSQIGEQFYPKTTTDAVFQPDSETGHATETTLTQILGAKADKVANATNGNLAGLDRNGNLTDSGFSSVDISLQSSTPKIYSYQYIDQLTSEQVDAFKLGDIVVAGHLQYGDNVYYVTYKDETDCNIDTLFNGESYQVTYFFDNGSWGYIGTEIISLNNYLIKIDYPTAGDFVAVSSTGYVYDSGKKASDFATSAQGALADTAYQKPSTGIPASDLASGVIPAPEIFVATVRTTTYQEISDALSDDKVVVMVDNNKTYYYTGIYNNRYTFFTFLGNNHYYALISIGSDNSWGIDSGAIELEFNKVFSLSSSSTDIQYPSAKCVYDTLLDYVQKSQTVGLLKNDGTVDTNTYLTQQDISGKADKVDTPQIIRCRFLSQLTKEQWDSLKAGDYITETVGYGGYIVTRIGSLLSNNKRLRLVSILTLPTDIGTVVKKDIFISEYKEGENSYTLSSKYHICDTEVASSMPQNGMLPNTLYNLGELVSDTTFVMAAVTDNTIANVWTWTFSTGSTTPTITWPAEITMWNGGEIPEIEANKYYEVSVMNGVGTIISADVPQTNVEP